MHDDAVTRAIVRQRENTRDRAGMRRPRTFRSGEPGRPVKNIARMMRVPPGTKISMASRLPIVFARLSARLILPILSCVNSHRLDAAESPADLSVRAGSECDLVRIPMHGPGQVMAQDGPAQPRDGEQSRRRCNLPIMFVFLRADNRLNLAMGDPAENERRTRG